jgi:hypothetical protein
MRSDSAWVACYSSLKASQDARLRAASAVSPAGAASSFAIAASRLHK